MDRNQQKQLIKAWDLQQKVVKEIHELAMMNTMLAYGVIRQSETLIDFIAVGNFHDAAKKIQEAIHEKTSINNPTKR
jgi:hypothetical protein